MHILGHTEKNMAGNSQCGLTKGKPCPTTLIASYAKVTRLVDQGEQWMSFTLILQGFQLFLQQYTCTQDNQMLESGGVVDWVGKEIGLLG